MPEQQRFEFLVFARRGAAGDVVAEPLVFEGHARTDERRGESQRHVSAAEYGVVDLFARRIQHGGVGVAVLGRAVGLYGLHAAVEDVVEPGDEIFAGQIVGVEDRDGFGSFGLQLFDREIQRLGLGAVFEGDLQHADRQRAQFGERFGFQPVGDDDHLVQLRGILLPQGRLRRADDHRVAFVGGNQRHELPPAFGLRIVVHVFARREEREDEKIEHRKSQYEDEDPVGYVQKSRHACLFFRVKKSRTPRHTAFARSPRRCASAETAFLGAAMQSW